MNQESWIRILDADAVSVDKPRPLKTHGKNIVVFQLADGGVHALDNRCPHEGYPLNTGMLADGILTCEWHNWKFQVCDGKCVLGGEDVYHYPLRIEDDGIWIDVTDPPMAERRPALYKSLEDAFDDDDWGWAARTSERLLSAGEAPEAILAVACDWAARRAPYGFDHGLAAAADLAGCMGGAKPHAWPDGSGEVDIGVPLLQAMNLLVQPNLRRPARAFPDAEDIAVDEATGRPDWTALGAELRRRIEVEDQAGAEALMRGALQAGAGPEQVFPWLLCAATDHFLGYGHAHIYCAQAEILLGRIGWQHAHPVLTSLVSRITLGTREDKLPYMREYRRQMAAYTPELENWATAARSATAGDGADLAPDELIAAVLDGSLADALAAVASRLQRGVAPKRVALVLALAAGQRLLRFDAELEARDDVSEGWLDITHALTHAEAVYQSLLAHPSAEGLRGLFYSARFVQHLVACDRPVEERVSLQAQPVGDDENALSELWSALQSDDPVGALIALEQCRRAGHPVAPVLRAAFLADRATRPIFVAHHVKAIAAALRLTAAVDRDEQLGQHAQRDAALAGAVWFLAHPLQERRVTRAARVSRVFVREGKMQKKLLGY